MEDFRTGDFARLKEITKWATRRILNRNLNIFEIIEIGNEDVKIKGIEERIPFFEIDPIPIDGFSDKDIYYDPVIAADIVPEGYQPPVRKRDESYYYEKFGQCFYQSKSFQELIKEKQCKYVHEIQHFLFDHFKIMGLLSMRSDHDKKLNRNNKK